MAEMMDDRSFASRGVGNAGLTLGIIGSALGLMNGNNGNGSGLNLFGNANAYSKKDEQINALANELMKEKSERYTDQKFCELKAIMYDKFEDVNASLCAQSTWNATNTANLTCINNQIAQLTSLLTYGVASDKVITAPASAS